MVIPAIEINTEIGRIAEVVAEIFARRGDRQRTQWEIVQDDVEAVGVIVDRYSELYRQLLLDVQWYGADEDLDGDEREQLVKEIDNFLTNETLLNQLRQIRGSLEVVSHDRKLRSSRHTELATDMRSLTGSIDAFIAHFERVMSGQPITTGAGAIRLWNLHDVYRCLRGESSEISVKEATEEAIRNRRPERARTIHDLVGRVLRGIGFDFLR